MVKTVPVSILGTVQGKQASKTNYSSFRARIIRISDIQFWSHLEVFIYFDDDDDDFYIAEDFKSLACRQALHH